MAKGTITAWNCDPVLNGFSTTNDYILVPLASRSPKWALAERPPTQPPAAWSGNTQMPGLLATYDGGSVNGTVTSPGLHFYFDDPLGTRRVQTDYEGGFG
ncbi:MAG: hypothetical protein P4L87_02565 [Formivibrio sp.]|nr:hypothetical protein [Formivibrio sp.]